jgi:hypothetical protein
MKRAISVLFLMVLLAAHETARATASVSPIPIVGWEVAEHIACPSVKQCTAVVAKELGKETPRGPAVEVTFAEVTFDPTRHPKAINGAVGLTETRLSLACPSVSQCTAVGQSGRVATFDPKSPGSPTLITLVGPRHSVRCPPVFLACGEEEDGGTLFDLACPTVSQCTTAEGLGNEVTFNPASPSGPLVEIEPLEVVGGTGGSPPQFQPEPASWRSPVPVRPSAR